MKYNVLELYAGTGRSVQPFLSWSKTGAVGLVDNSSYARDVYISNFPSANYLEADLSATKPQDLISLVGGTVDILLGCPPCQGFSDCGSRKKNDGRKRHIGHYETFVRTLRPKALALENVPLAARSEPFRRFTASLQQLGYLWSSSIINAACWGSCQTRQRLVLVAFQKRFGTPQFPAATHGGDDEYFHYGKMKFCKIADDPVGILGRTPATQRIEKRVLKRAGEKANEKGLSIPKIKTVFDGLPSVGTPLADEMDHVPSGHSPEMLDRMAAVQEGDRWQDGTDHFSQAYGRLHREGLSRTITNFFPNAGSGRFWHPTENRAITLREAARIQGFPDTFKFGKDDVKNRTLVGNALDSAISTLVFTTIANAPLDS
jgi:DNA (cytosine-5)-methyltransferase 1